MCHAHHIDDRIYALIYRIYSRSMNSTSCGCDPCNCIKIWVSQWSSLEHYDSSKCATNLDSDWRWWWQYCNFQWLHQDTTWAYPLAAYARWVCSWQGANAETLFGTWQDIEDWNWRFSKSEQRSFFLWLPTDWEPECFGAWCRSSWWCAYHV